MCSTKKISKRVIFKKLATGLIREFESGAHRDANDDKGRMDLLPWLALIRLSKYYQEGAKRYGENNWRKGIPIPVLLDSGMRHGAKRVAGFTDEKHLDAAVWNLLNAMEMEEQEKSELPTATVDIETTKEGNPIVTRGFTHGTFSCSKIAEEPEEKSNADYHPGRSGPIEFDTKR